MIIIMEICKAPTLRPKALNKHNIAHIMYIETKKKCQQFSKKLTHHVDIDKGSSITM